MTNTLILIYPAIARDMWLLSYPDMWTWVILEFAADISGLNMTTDPLNVRTS